MNTRTGEPMRAEVGGDAFCLQGRLNLSPPIRCHPACPLPSFCPQPLGQLLQLRYYFHANASFQPASSNEGTNRTGRAIYSQCCLFACILGSGALRTACTWRWDSRMMPVVFTAQSVWIRAVYTTTLVLRSISEALMGRLGRIQAHASTSALMVLLGHRMTWEST